MLLAGVPGIWVAVVCLLTVAAAVSPAAGLALTVAVMAPYAAVLGMRRAAEEVGCVQLCEAIWELERDIGGLGYAHDGLIAGFLLPCRSNGFDFVAIFLGIWVIDDEHLGAKAFGRGLILALPLAINVYHAEARRKPRGNFTVEKGPPFTFAYTLLMIADLIHWTEAEVELGIDPALGATGMGGVPRQSGSCNARRRSIRVCTARQCQCQKRGKQDATSPHSIS